MRGSVIVDSKDQIPVILKHIQGLPIKNFDDKFTNPTSLGYKDISFLYPTSQGVLAETQINIPGMIIAKEGKLAVEMGVVSQEAYDQMIKKAGVEGGLGHKYYEEWRSLEEIYKTASKQQQSIIEKKMKQIESESRDYYTKFE